MHTEEVKSLYDRIREAIATAMKSGLHVERDTLRTVLGEVQRKVDSKPTDADIEAVLKKSKLNAEDVLSMLNDPKNHFSGTEADKIKLIANYNRSIRIYNDYLPKTLTVQEVMDILTSNTTPEVRFIDYVDQIKAAKSDGQATGIAMGFLKKGGHKVDGKDVSAAVASIRKA